MSTLISRRDTLKETYAESRIGLLNALRKMEAAAKTLRLDFSINNGEFGWTVDDLEEFPEELDAVSVNTLIRLENEELLGYDPLIVSLQHAEQVLIAKSVNNVCQGSLLVLQGRLVLRVAVLNELAWQLQSEVVSYVEKTAAAASQIFANSTVSIQSLHLGSVTLNFTNRPTEFTLYCLTQGYNGEFEYPHNDELAVTADFDGNFDEAAAWAVMMAYIHRLDRTFGIQVTPRGPRPLPSALPEPLEELHTDEHRKLTLDAAYLSKGATELLTLYQRGVVFAAEDQEAASFLEFFKVLEYTAASAARLKVRHHVETVGLDNLKKLKKVSVDMDADTLRIAELIVQACDVSRLRQVCPVGKPDLVAVLTNTRNMLSHAKPGYSNTGNEIPREDLTAGVAFVKEAAAQALDWFLKLSLTDQVTN